MRRLAEENNLVPTETDEGINRINQVMAAGGGRQLVMKEYARPIIGTVVSYIQLSEAARNYELKNVQFTMLPSFYGIPNEDPLIFIWDFYATVLTFPLQGLTENQLRMRCFPYTLKDRAKAWLMTLPPNSLRPWEAVYEKFKGKFYSHQKTTELRAKLPVLHKWKESPFIRLGIDLSNYSFNVPTTTILYSYKISSFTLD